MNSDIENNNTGVVHEILPWSEYFNTGIDIIDEQHKRWIELLNLLAKHSHNHANQTVLDTVFNELFAYTQYHFTTEEMLWQQYFPQDIWESKHRAVHEQFISELRRLKEEESRLPLSEVVENILAFLVPWLAYHILVSDRRMAKIVLTMQAGLSLELAKQQSENEIANYKPDTFTFK